MDLQFKTFPFEVKQSSADGSTFEGLVSVFHNIDSYGEIVDDEAFNADLPEFMSEGFIGGLNHNWDDPIGTPQDGTKVVKEGLLLHGNVIDTAHGMDVRKMLKAGVVKKLSIGFRSMGRQTLETQEDVEDYWKSKGYSPNADDLARAQSGATVLTRIKLYEGSPVTVAANDLAVITAVKAAREAAAAVYAQTPPVQVGPAEQSERLTSIRKIASLSEAEDILRDADFSRTERAAFISSVKALLRDAASGDTDAAETDEGEGAPAANADPSAEPDANPDGSETPPQDEQEGEVEVIVTDPEPIIAYNSVQLTEQKKKIARDIARSLAVLDAEITLAFACNDGR